MVEDALVCSKTRANRTKGRTSCPKIYIIYHHIMYLAMYLLGSSRSVSFTSGVHRSQITILTHTLIHLQIPNRICSEKNDGILHFMFTNSPNGQRPMFNHLHTIFEVNHGFFAISNHIFAMFFAMLNRPQPLMNSSPRHGDDPVADRRGAWSPPDMANGRWF